MNSGFVRVFIARLLLFCAMSSASISICFSCSLNISFFLCALLHSFCVSGFFVFVYCLVQFVLFCIPLADLCQGCRPQDPDRRSPSPSVGKPLTCLAMESGYEVGYAPSVFAGSPC